MVFKIKRPIIFKFFTIKPYNVIKYNKMLCTSSIPLFLPRYDQSPYSKSQKV